MPKIGILLTNTGTPNAPTKRAVRAYLREFLSDKRIVHLPRLIWLPILHSLILPLRPRRSAKLYQKIWSEDGSPMRVLMQQIQMHLQQTMQTQHDIEIELGMNYGQPSIKQGLTRLINKKIEKLIVLPLFPQYSNTTTASTFDRVTTALRAMPALPTLNFIHHYADNAMYLHALAQSVHRHWKTHGRAQHLLISFHGIPKRFVETGDPYQSHCEQTANLLAKELNLSACDWTLCYQSQFGYDKWLQPSTQSLLTNLPQQNIKHIDIICPGFAVDCLETLEEIAMGGKEIFLHAGGETLRYIPALNHTEHHVAALSAILSKSLTTSV